MPVLLPINSFSVQVFARFKRKLVFVIAYESTIILVVGNTPKLPKLIHLRKVEKS